MTLLCNKVARLVKVCHSPVNYHQPLVLVLSLKFNSVAFNKTINKLPVVLLRYLLCMFHFTSFNRKIILKVCLFRINKKFAVISALVT